jgi:DNA-binding NarL/FixJ family response regulator
MAPMRPEPSFARLTERERDVLALLAEGRSNAAAARQLHTTERTVETHVRHIFVKLGLYDSDDDHRRVLAVLAYLRNSS